MEKKIFECDNCKAIADDEAQLREENWISIHGGIDKGIRVWLKTPRKKIKGVSESYIILVGWKDREYHFCSIECLSEALNGDESV